MTFISFVSGLSLSLLHSSKPYILGSATSRRARNRSSLIAFFIVSIPSLDVITVYPFFVRKPLIFPTIAGSSCATITFPSRGFIRTAGFFTRRTALHFGHLNLTPSGVSFSSAILSFILHLGQL